MDIEGCHQLPLSRNNSGDTKRVIVKLVNRKHSEDMLQLRKIISFRSKVFISNLLWCHYYLWGKCKELQQRGIFNQVFCLGAVVTIKVSKNGLPVKIYHKNDLKIYQGYGNARDGEWTKASLFLKVCSQHLFWWGLVLPRNQLIS